MSFFKKWSRINWLVAVLLVINIASITALWMRGKGSKGPNKHMRPDGGGFLAKQLNLNDEQKKQVEKLRAEHFQEVRALQRASGEVRRKMFKEIEQIKPDSILIVKYAAEIGSTVAEIETRTSQHFLDIKSILTEKQLVQFHRIVEQLMPHPGPPPQGGRHGPGPGHGPGRGRPPTPPPGR